MAAGDTFHLVVASVGETRFDGAAQSVTVPSEGGELTILPHHEPIVATLKRGTIRVRTSAETMELPIDGGVIECTGDRAVVLL